MKGAVLPVNTHTLLSPFLCNSLSLLWFTLALRPLDPTRLSIRPNQPFLPFNNVLPLSEASVVDTDLALFCRDIAELLPPMAHQ